MKEEETMKPIVDLVVKTKVKEDTIINIMIVEEGVDLVEVKQIRMFMVKGGY